jgi:hypothetical protein
MSKLHKGKSIPRIPLGGLKLSRHRLYYERLEILF